MGGSYGHLDHAWRSPTNGNSPPRDIQPTPQKNTQAADKEGVSKFGKRVLFDAATELPGSGVTSNGFKYTTKVI